MDIRSQYLFAIFLLKRITATYLQSIFAPKYTCIVSEIKAIKDTDLRLLDALLYPKPEVALFCGQDQCFGPFEDCGRDDLLADRLNADVAAQTDRAEQLDRADAHPRGEHQKRRAEPELLGQPPEQSKGGHRAQRQAEAKQELVLEDCGEGSECITERGRFHSSTTRFFLSRPKTASTTASRVLA